MRKSSKTNKVNCKTCGKEFLTQKNQFCSTRCRNIDYAKQDSEKLQGTENVDYVVCRWCGMKAERLYISHIKVHHPGKSTDDYRREFPDAKLACSKDNNNVAKAFVKYSRSEEGRKRASEKISGSLNPNSKEKTSEETRKSRSPFSTAFYTKNGFTEIEAKEKISKFASDLAKERLTETQLEYWVQRTNGNIDLAKEFLKRRQQTFSLEKCIERLGEVEGKKRWQKRQDDWKKKVFNDVQFIGKGKSEISYELFSKLTDDKFVYTNEKFIRKGENVYKYDYCDKNQRKIIEFNGDFWHCNPFHFLSEFYHPVKKKTAQEIWDYDAQKIKTAEEHGYRVLTIWEKDYREFPEETVQKCIQFLNEETSS